MRTLDVGYFLIDLREELKQLEGACLDSEVKEHFTSFTGCTSLEDIFYTGADYGRRTMLSDIASMLEYYNLDLSELER